MVNPGLYVGEINQRPKIKNIEICFIVSESLVCIFGFWFLVFHLTFPKKSAILYMYLEKARFVSSNHNFPLFVIGTHKLSHSLFPTRKRVKNKNKNFCKFL
ncbi:MAG: hypothetical protein A3J76_06140 [Candidatus Moranbacteria bacterium RBG_13_45_13]|nr:MAG: hypothetical protein A3J76_06140 [Candidatus Moranbacteria bacterium RBG_13_45_13]